MRRTLAAARTAADGRGRSPHRLWHYCRLAIPDVDERIGAGDFAPILSWLRETVHDRGVVHPSMDERLTASVGEPLNPEYFITYLEDKFSKLYGLD